MHLFRISVYFHISNKPVRPFYKYTFLYILILHILPAVRIFYYVITVQISLNRYTMFFLPGFFFLSSLPFLSGLGTLAEGTAAETLPVCAA